MNSRIISLKLLDNFLLELTFTNNEVREFDMKPYLSYPVYEPLNDKVFFQKARVLMGTVAWNDEIDMSPATLYLKSRTVVSQ